MNAAEWIVNDFICPVMDISGISPQWLCAGEGYGISNGSGRLSGIGYGDGYGDYNNRSKWNEQIL